MKHLKHLLTAALTMLMALAIATPAFAANGTIAIKPPTGVDADAINTYKIYKVFDAEGNGTAISYKVMASKSGVPDVAAQMEPGTYDAKTVDHFIVDAAGNVHYGTETTNATGETVITDSSATNLSAAAVKAIAAYVAGDQPVDTATSTGAATATSSSLPNGFYYITTSTGTVVTIDSTNPSAQVNDKNTVPSVDKTITGAHYIDADGKKALAEVGSTVTYSAEITIGEGAKSYVFHDTMETGLTYNNDAAVTGVAAGATTYTVGKEGTDTFTITFNDDFIKGYDAGDTLTITYTATVNDDAVTVDPLHNTAYVSYGDKNSNNKTPVTEADVYEAKFTVIKKDGNGDPLSGAGFVIAKDVAATPASGTEGQADYVPAVEAHKEYYKITNKVVSWVTDIAQATEYFSDAQGNVTSFTGLADGTYTLIEKTVPAGYNKANDQSFTIAGGNYTAANLEQSAEVTNNAGTVLPSTGGIGTTIFYVVGGALVITAGVLLVTKRRMASLEK